MQHFEKLGLNLNGLLVKVLDSQTRIAVFKTIGWLQGWLSLLLFQVRQIEYQEIDGYSVIK